MAIDLEKIRKRNNSNLGESSTHYTGCEYHHRSCAINALCNEVERLRGLVPNQNTELNNGWIGVDLDGTLAETVDWTKGCGIGAPIPAMVERVKRWLDEGREVRILTARVAITNEFSPISNRFADDGFVGEQIELIEAWCFEHIGARLPITSEKDFRMIELWDDRAVQVIQNTGQTLEEYLFEKSSDNVQQRVYANTVARGYRDGWTPEQFLARQIAKLAEELSEVARHTRGLDTNLMIAILHAGAIAKEQFDNKDFWSDDIKIDPKIGSEIADCQVVVFNLAESLTEITRKMFNVSGAALEKSSGDIQRGVRNS